jgi:hypothetical protein
MKALTELEIERTALLKAARAAIRLKHSLAADREIYECLPKIEEAIDLAIQSGQPFELNPGQVFDGELFSEDQ